MSESNYADSIIVSEGILRDGNFGVYASPAENPSIEYRLLGGFASPDQARARAKDVLPKIPGLEGVAKELDSIEYRERPEIDVDRTWKTMRKEDLMSSLQAHIDLWFAHLSKSKIVKGLLSYGNLIFLLSCLAIWLFWTGTLFTIPKGLDLPIVGDRLGGIEINAKALARYYPTALLILYAGAFLAMLKTNLQYDLLRQQILALVFIHKWRVLDFVNLLQTRMLKGDLGWFVHALGGLYEHHPASLSSLRKAASTASQDSDGEESSPRKPEVKNQERIPSDVRAKLDQELAQRMPSEFERRIHNLYFLDREKDYSRFFICFDPLIYIISQNRVIFWTYEFLKQRGVPVDPYNPPTDPYQVERFAAPIFWAGEAIRFLFLGGVIVWSFMVTAFSSKVLFITNIVATAMVLFVPTWWNYQVVRKHRGFPKTEPLGAYTAGPLAPNRLSVL